MLLRLLTATALLATLPAFAGTAEDVTLIRKLLPAGSDVAQIQARILRGISPAEAIESAKTNYLIRDIDGDGRADILVISETNPQLINYKTNQPCEHLDPPCTISWGKRTLSLYLGQTDGTYRLAFANDKFVMGGDDGGVFGDPLNGLTLLPSGAIELFFYGGSSWRWSYTDTMQFLNGDLYVIAEASYSGWTGDGRYDIKSVNLLTGDSVEKQRKTGDAPEEVEQSKQPVKPLVRVADYAGQSE